MADDQPLVSVVLPFFNAPYLSEAIESILCQTYSNFELVLVNNCSNDGSLKVAESYLDNPKFKLHSESRQGVAFAANTAIRHSKGQFIARMDADDISEPDRLKKQVNFLVKNPNVGVVSGLISYLGSDGNTGFSTYVDWLNTINTPEKIYLNQFVEFPLANPSLMFRRELFDKYGFFDVGHVPEDYELFLRLQSQGVQMDKVTNPVLKWRDTPTRLTRTNNNYAHEAFYRVKARYLARWLKVNNSAHPHVYVWGAGRLSRRRSDLLVAEGVQIEKYVDFKTRGKTISYDTLWPKDGVFIVSYVANRGARAEIKAFLEERGFREGKNFILAA